MRITGGQYRSRNLTAPRGAATRPTSDRVREALFGILGSAGAVSGRRVLDLYAGTGALAFEALSRGADHAALVEPSRAALLAIHQNAQALGVADRVRVVASTVERAAPSLRTSGPFDLVFADPPYALVTSGEAALALTSLLGPWLLAPGARLVLEHGKGDAAPDLAAFERHDSRRYGDTILSFYELRPVRPQEPVTDRAIEPEPTVTEG